MSKSDAIGLSAFAIACVAFLFAVGSLTTFAEVGSNMWIWETQPSAYFTVAPPVSGTEYTVLNTTANCRIKGVSVYVSAVVPVGNLELRIYLDDVVYLYLKGSAGTGTYWASFCPSLAESAQLLSTGNPHPYLAFLHEGRSVNVTLEATGGVVNSISCRVHYWIKY